MNENRGNNLFPEIGVLSGLLVVSLID